MLSTNEYKLILTPYKNMLLEKKPIAFNKTVEMF